MNKELFTKSPKLSQYAEFIAKIRELNKLYDDYARAVKDATDFCITNDILSEFLRERGGKIVSILATEFDLETAKRVWREETIEDIVKNMLKRNMTIEDIIDITGLTYEEVDSLIGTNE